MQGREKTHVQKKISDFFNVSKLSPPTADVRAPKSVKRKQKNTQVQNSEQRLLANELKCKIEKKTNEDVKCLAVNKTKNLKQFEKVQFERSVPKVISKNMDNFNFSNYVSSLNNDTNVKRNATTSLSTTPPKKVKQDVESNEEINCKQHETSELEFEGPDVITSIKEEPNDDVGNNETTSDTGNENDDIVCVSEYIDSMQKNEDYKNRLMKTEKCDEALEFKSEFVDKFQTLLYDSSKKSYLQKIMLYVIEHFYLYNLLYNGEIQLLHVFFSLPDDYQFFCYKLFTRQSKWQNILKFLNDIKMPQDKTTCYMITTLSEKGIVTTDYTTENFYTLLDLLTVEDLKTMHKDFKIKHMKRMTKNQLIWSILNYCKSQTTLTSDQSSILREKIGPCIQLTHGFHTVLFRLHLLYSFTNKDLNSTFKLQQFMDKINNADIILPSYTVHAEKIFDKESFAMYSSAWEYYQDYEKYSEKKKSKVEILLEIGKLVYSNFQEIVKTEARNNFLDRFNSGYIYIALLSRFCSDFPKEHDIILPILKSLLDQNKYCHHKRGNWYGQIATIYTKHFIDIDKAAQYLLEGLNCTYINDIQIEDLWIKANALIKRKKNRASEALCTRLAQLLPSKSPKIPSIQIFGTAVSNFGPGHKAIYSYETEDATVVGSVEEFTINHYASQGYRAIHCEGSLMVTIYIILFWDIIYEINVPQTFVSEIQTLPLDFFTPDFYTNRKSAIDKRLQDIAENWTFNQLTEFMYEHLKLHSNHYTGLCSLEILSNTEIIFDAMVCLGRKALSMICGRLAISFKEHRSGMPDLFVWTRDTGKCKFVEVKGHGDRIASNQSVWMKYLLNLGIDVEVCHVNSKGTKRANPMTPDN
ncbi:PREDICTED: fanconi-associated nuclease 1-like [Nicrophorus vespilloides]|uniref:Fanconi-associated nuclease n=1 Tax=Nicrophorus vespilloides TaxID=110193 RepID=A0ABM1M3S4_NICVS|nr:PREDICTED: fanconi-associated nuclease 1-like [Nicrophorus vespilloides]